MKRIKILIIICRVCHYVLVGISHTVAFELCIHSYIVLGIFAGKIYAMYNLRKMCI